MGRENDIGCENLSGLFVKQFPSGLDGPLVLMSF